jgi:hypothetical protein
MTEALPFRLGKQGIPWEVFEAARSLFQGLMTGISLRKEYRTSRLKAKVILVRITAGARLRRGLVVCEADH